MSDQISKILLGCVLVTVILVLCGIFPAIAVMVTAIVIVGFFVIFKE